MHRILSKIQLSPDVFRMTFDAPHLARERQAGQFLILQLDNDFGERIPLTIADADPVKGTVTIIFQAVGATTRKLSHKIVGDFVPNVLGPLGQPTHIRNVGRVVCVGGGIGVAPLYPIAQAMKQAGNHLTVIMGARNRELLILKKEMGTIADQLVVCTDDGSFGRKDLVTTPLREICGGPTPPQLVLAIGPPIMMKFCAQTTLPFGIPTVVSLNTIMVDGTGMCGGCRVTVGGKTKFVCVDGPEFDGHTVDFDNMMLRLKSYKTKEEEDHHRCLAEAAADRLAKAQEERA